MYCVYCGQTYEAWLLEGGRCNRMIVCKPCYDKPCTEEQSIFKYCCDCGIELSKDKTCPVCSKNKASKRSLKWQAKNRHKVNTEQYSRVHADSLTILYECRCGHLKKHNHHFSYDPEFRLVVIRLCPACHAAEHARLRSLQPALAEAI